MTRPMHAGSRTALLLMDLMRAVVPTYGGDQALLHRLASAARTARNAHVDVIHIHVQFRNGASEIGAANKVFAQAAAALTRTTDESDLHPAVPVMADDFVITKKRISAFSGSDLDLVLRARSVGTLVLAGVATSGVVLSTLRQAADLDYGIVVLEDGCADRDQELHEVLMSKVFASQAGVVSTSDWCTSLDVAD
jgi:nicotinamidase-related amidase